MTRTIGIAFLAGFLLALSGCAAPSYMDRQAEDREPPREPTVEELTGKWVTHQPPHDVYVLIKRVGRGQYAVQTWGVYDAEAGKCDPKAWAPVRWDGDVITWRHGTEWDPTYNPASGEMTLMFDSGKRVLYEPARRHPAEVCGLKTDRGAEA